MALISLSFAFFFSVIEKWFLWKIRQKNFIFPSICFLLRSVEAKQIFHSVSSLRKRFKLVKKIYANPKFERSAVKKKVKKKAVTNKSKMANNNNNRYRVCQWFLSFYVRSTNAVLILQNYKKFTHTQTLQWTVVVNERINEWANKWMDEWMSERTANKCMNE